MCPGTLTLFTKPWAVHYSLCLKLIFEHACLGCDPPSASSTRPDARMVPTRQHRSADGAARPPPGTRAGHDGLLPDTVPGSTHLHSGDDPASPSQCKLVFPHCPLQVSGRLSTVQFPRPFRGCPPWTSCGIPRVKGFASLLSCLPVQQQASPSGPRVPRAQEQTLHPLLEWLVAT